MKRKLYQEIANRINARQNCLKSGNDEWFEKHTAVLWELENELPSGSGIDSGTKLDLESSTDEKIILNLAYHHMNENGMYDGWTEHKAIITPSLAFGFLIRITGRDRNQIKEYLHDTLRQALEAEVE